MSAITNTVLLVLRLIVYAILSIFALLATIAILQSEWDVLFSILILSILPLFLLLLVHMLTVNFGQPSASRQEKFAAIKKSLVGSVLDSDETVIKTLACRSESKNDSSRCAVLTNHRLLIILFCRKRNNWIISDQETLYYPSITSIRVENATQPSLKGLLALNIFQGQSSRTLFAESGSCNQFSRELDKQLRANSNPKQSPQAISSELASLNELRKSGVLTDKDWERCLNHFVGSPPDETKQAADKLRHLHELHRSGTITTGEFNMTKWEILSRQK